MKFGIFFEIPTMRPWTDRTEKQAYDECIIQSQYAEQMGFDSFFTVEHHFLDEFSHCSAPEVLYGAMTQRLKKMRIGHGVRLLPYPYNHPVRVAEQAAVLDILADGRSDFGTGRSITRLELEGFGINPKEARKLWEESMQLIMGIWKTPRDQKFSWESEHFKVPPRYIVPRPIQRPHPPLWLAATSPESHELAGHYGLGLMSLTLLVEPEELGRRVQLYRNAFKTCEPIGVAKNEQVATFTLIHCAPTMKEAVANAGEAVTWYILKSFDYILETTRYAAELGGEKPLGDYEYLQQMMRVKREDINLKYLDEHELVIVGDPEHCYNLLKNYEAAGTDTVLCFMQQRGIPHEKVIQSLRLFGEEIIPRFKK